MAFDYRGEPTPLLDYQVSSNFGVMDTCGFPKDDYYHYKSLLTNNPMVHIMPYWTWQNTGAIKSVRLYANCEEVEFFLNGESLGRKSLEDDWVQYDTPCSPGELAAIGYIGGLEMVRDSKKLPVYPHN